MKMDAVRLLIPLTAGLMVGCASMRPGTAGVADGFSCLLGWADAVVFNNPRADISACPKLRLSHEPEPRDPQPPAPQEAADLLPVGGANVGAEKGEEP